MREPLDLFYWICIASCLVLPASLLFVWWRRKVIAQDEFARLEMHAAYEEHSARDRLGRVSSYERMPTYKSPSPSARPRQDTPAPTWVRTPQQDDPAPLFDALLGAAPVVMENVSVVESPSGYDFTPSNDNGAPADAGSFDGGGGGSFGGGGSTGEW